MGKRKHSSEDYYSTARKIKKLERKLMRIRKRRQASTSSTSPRNLATNTEEGTQLEGFLPIYEERLEVAEKPVNTVDTQSPPSTSTDEPPALTLSEDVVEEQQGVSEELNAEIVELLGEDPTIVKENGKDIQSDLAVRIQHVATKGLSKKVRKELRDKYLPPGNCPLIRAPALNPEIEAAVSGVVIKRDKNIEFKQKQLCCAISAIGEALILLLAKDDKDATVIKILMDATRILCDCQNLNSLTRRNFVFRNINKDMKHQLQKTIIDKLLFGSNLAETLKTAKTITKYGTKLKQVPSANSNGKNNSRQRRHLHWL